MKERRTLTFDPICFSLHHVFFFQSLFDLKTSENEKLLENLEDTIKQLEEKSAVLLKTQEEKEVQVGNIWYTFIVKYSEIFENYLHA